MEVRERLAKAALSLFEERGFEQTTVDDITDRAGVGRTTFFRHFRSKEDAILPDHGRLLAQVEGRLAPSTEDLTTRLTEAARIVLDHYLAEGAVARTRYRLVSSVPAIRAREVAGQQAYQRIFRAAIHRELGGGPGTRLQAELMANAVVTAHNHVLRDWLRDDCDTPHESFDRAMTRATAAPPSTSPSPALDPELVDAAVTALPLLEELLPLVRRLAQRRALTTGPDLRDASGTIPDAGCP